MKPWRTEGLARWRRIALALSIVSGLAAPIGLAVAEAPADSELRLAPPGLERITDYLRHEITTGKIPGAIMLIERHGVPVYSECFGVRDMAGQRPMTLDTIFRLYSMTKPITSVAVMMLVEDGKLKLDDPLEKYIPAFADTRVGIDKLDDSGQPLLTLEPPHPSLPIPAPLRPTPCP